MKGTARPITTFERSGSGAPGTKQSRGMAQSQRSIGRSASIATAGGAKRDEGLGIAACASAAAVAARSPIGGALRLRLPVGPKVCRSLTPRAALVVARAAAVAWRLREREPGPGREPEGVARRAVAATLALALSGTGTGSLAPCRTAAMTAAGWRLRDASAVELEEWVRDGVARSGFGFAVAAESAAAVNEDEDKDEAEGAGEGEVLL